MATKIIDRKQRGWDPVTIEMEFTTREELAVFLEMLGSHISMADAIKEMSHTHHIVDRMTADEISTTIDSMMDLETWRELMIMLD